jgi:hypothetical protein
MKRLIAWSLLFAMLAGLTVLPWLMLERRRLIGHPASFATPICWIKSLFQKHDPRRQTPDVIQTIQLDGRTQPPAQLRSRTAPDQRHCRRTHTQLATLTAPPCPPTFGRHLNLTAKWQISGSIRIQSLQLGSLPLPGALTDGIARLAHRLLRRDEPMPRWPMRFAGEFR